MRKKQSPKQKEQELKYRTAELKLLQNIDSLIVGMCYVSRDWGTISRHTLKGLQHTIRRRITDEEGSVRESMPLPKHRFIYKIRELREEIKKSDFLDYSKKRTYNLYMDTLEKILKHENSY